MCERVGRPCVVTRLMDSMIFAPRPTRAEATDIANIVLDGADGLLLGLETLEGKFPLDCLETTLAIAREADAVYDYESRYRRQMQQINVKLAKATDSVPWGERDAAIVVPQAAGERGGADAFGGDKNPPAVDARDAAGAQRQQPLFSERRRANSMAARLE
jgi:pyruvate kinase